MCKLCVKGCFWIGLDWIVLILFLVEIVVVFIVVAVAVQTPFGSLLYNTVILQRWICILVAIKFDFPRDNNMQTATNMHDTHLCKKSCFAHRLLNTASSWFVNCYFYFNPTDCDLQMLLLLLLMLLIFIHLSLLFFFSLSPCIRCHFLWCSELFIQKKLG